MSIFISILFFIFVISSLIALIFTKKQRYYAYKIYFSVLTIYLLVYLLAILSYYDNNQFSLFSDQELFFAESNFLGSQDNITSIYKLCFIDKIHIENEGAYFFFGVIAFIANNVLDGNTPYIQMLWVSFLACLIPLFVYKSLINFFHEKISYSYSIKYAVFSCILFYSPWLLRDIHIALLYSIAISIVLSTFSFLKLGALCLVIYITSLFRMEHGFFLLSFFLLYFYDSSNKFKSYKLIVLLSLTIIIILLLPFILIQFNEMSHGLSLYADYSSEASLQGGLGRYIYMLPFGIKELVLIAYSQVSPFPAWYFVDLADTFPLKIIGSLSMIIPIFWFILCYSTIKSLKYLKAIKLLPSKVWYLGWLFIIFLLANTSNIGTRRIMCMYPIAYLFYVFVSIYNKKKAYKYKLQALSILFILHFLYFILKL